eukprot:749343-Hanusia_phi.AAC.1
MCPPLVPPPRICYRGGANHAGMVRWALRPEVELEDERRRHNECPQSQSYSSPPLLPSPVPYPPAPAVSLKLRFFSGKACSSRAEDQHNS